MSKGLTAFSNATVTTNDKEIPDRDMGKAGSGMVCAQSIVIDRGAGFCPEELMRFLFIS